MPRLNLIIANVSLATLAVALFQWLVGFPPLVLFILPVAIAFRTHGFAAALTTAIVGAIVGDFFFVAPLGSVTVLAGGLRLLVWLLLGASIVHVMAPRGALSHRPPR